MLRDMSPWIGYWWKLTTLPCAGTASRKRESTCDGSYVAEYMAVLKGVAVEELAQVPPITSPVCFTSTLPAFNPSVNEFF